MKIDKTNYTDATWGKFKSIPWSWAKTLTTVGMYTPCYLGGKVWHFDHANHGKKGQSFSGYWLSEDGEHLIRISDHWSYFSKRRHKDETGLKKCKKVRSCIWSMKQKPKVVEVERADNPSKKLKVAGGYIRFDKMQKVEDIKFN